MARSDETAARAGRGSAVKVSWFSLGAWLCLAPACSRSAADQARAASHAAQENVPGASLYAKGIESADHEDFARAEQYFAASLGHGYPETRAVRWLVRVCLASGRLRTALRYAEPYLLRHPDEAGLLQLVAVVRLSLGDAMGARTALEHAIAVDPDRAQARYLLAVVLRDGFHEPDSAARQFSAYVSALPTGEHAPEARSFLDEHATVRRAEPTGHQHLAHLRDESDASDARERGGSGPRGSSSTHATVATRATAPAPR